MLLGSGLIALGVAGLYLLYHDPQISRAAGGAAVLIAFGYFCVSAKDPPRIKSVSRLDQWLFYLGAAFDIASTAFDLIETEQVEHLGRRHLRNITLPDGLVTGIGFFTERQRRSKAAIDDVTVYGKPYLDDDHELTIPVASYTSPAYIEGLHPRGKPVSIQAGAAVTTQAIGDRFFFANVALDADTPVTVVASDSEGQTVGETSITWLETEAIAGKLVLVRAGDSLRIRFPEQSSPVVIGENCGVDADFTAASTDPIEVLFPDGGDYQIHWIDGEQNSASMTIRAVAAAPIDDLACEALFARPLPTESVDPSTVFWMPAVGCDAVFNEAADGVQRIMPIANSDVTLALRLGDAQGPIIDTVDISVFKLWTSASKYIGVVERFADGSLLVEAELYQEPHVPGLDIVLDVINPGVTFADSSMRYTTTTDLFGPTQGGPFGEAYQMIIMPELIDHSSPCHTAAVFQDGIQIGEE